MQRTGLNRHRRGYATKEAGRAVHFPVSGPIGLARSPILIIIVHHHLHHIIKYQQILLKLYRSYSTKQAYDPIILVIRENIKEWNYQTYLMQLSIKTTPTNVMHKNTIKYCIQLDLCKDSGLDEPVLAWLRLGVSNFKP